MTACDDVAKWAKRVKRQVQADLKNMRMRHHERVALLDELKQEHEHVQSAIDALCALPPADIAKTDAEIVSRMEKAASEMRGLAHSQSKNRLQFPLRQHPVVEFGLARSVPSLLPGDGPHRDWLQARMLAIGKDLVRVRTSCSYCIARGAAFSPIDISLWSCVWLAGSRQYVVQGDARRMDEH